MTLEDVDDILAEMAVIRQSTEEDINLSGSESLIHEEELSPYLFEELVEELAEESGLEFNF